MRNRRPKPGKNSRRLAVWGVFCVVGLGFFPQEIVSADPYRLTPDHGVIQWQQTLLEMATPLRLMCVAAHPDDEDGETLAYYNRGFGVRTSIVFANWGEGGQNETGPELYEELGVIRSHETLEAAKILGTRVYCLNRKDFGYSKSAEETWRFWNHDEALETLVRILREERPHVVITNHRVGKGHGNHQAVAQLIEEAIPLAASPEAYAEQLETGLSVWKVERLFQRRRHHEGTQGEEFDVMLPVARRDPARGVSYQEIAGEALLRHRSQGIRGVWDRINENRRSSPFNYYFLIVGDPPLGPFTDLFQGLKGCWWEKEGIRPFSHNGILHGTPTWEEKRRNALRSALEELRPDLKNLETDLVQALEAVKNLPAEIDEDPRWENVPPQRVRNASVSWTAEDMREYQSRVIDRMQSLGEEQRRLEKLLGQVWGLELEAVLPEETLCPGKVFTLKLLLRNHGDSPVRVDGYSVTLPKGWSKEALHLEIGHLDPLGTACASYRIRIPTTETPTPPPTVGLYRDPIPWRPNLDVRCLVSKGETTASVAADRRIRVRPSWKITFEPSRTLVPIHTTREQVFLVRTERITHRVEDATLEIEYPGGVTEIRRLPRGADRRTWTRFHWKVPDEVTPGNRNVRIRLETGSGLFHATGEIVFAEVSVPKDLRVGIIRSYDDTLVTALETLGLEPQPLLEKDVRLGAFTGYDTILIDIRAYLVREDLRESNDLLLEYVKNGGHVVVFYHKTFEWNDKHPSYAPYPLELSRFRVTDEKAPVQVLDPEHPVFNQPNRINEADWSGWIQERGLYFPGTYDARYRELVAMSDPGEPTLRSGILWAEYGDGTYVYTSLVFYRQLRALVPGAYRLFANLITPPTD